MPTGRAVLDKVTDLLMDATARLIGRTTGGAGVAEELTAAAARTLLDVPGGAAALSSGLLPYYDGADFADSPIDRVSATKARVTDTLEVTGTLEVDIDGDGDHPIGRAIIGSGPTSDSAGLSHRDHNGAGTRGFVQTQPGNTFVQCAAGMDVVFQCAGVETMRINDTEGCLQIASDKRLKALNTVDATDETDGAAVIDGGLSVAKASYLKNVITTEQGLRGPKVAGILDDTVATFTPSQTRGTWLITAVGNSVALNGLSALIGYAAQSSGRIDALALGDHFEAAAFDTNLTGMIGSDGKITISVRANGDIQVENRRGATASFRTLELNAGA